MSVYNMSASFKGIQKLRAGEDEVFGTVTAQVNPRLRQRLTNYEDVLGEVEEQTGMDIKFSQKQYIFVGSWSQLVAAKEILERYTENNTPLSGSSDPEEFGSFLVVDKIEKTEKKLQNSQKDGNWVNIMARKEMPSRKYEDGAPNPEEIEDSYEKMTTLQRSSPGLEDALERDRSGVVNIRDGHTESMGTAGNQQVEEEGKVQNEKRSEYISKARQGQHEQQQAEVEAQNQLEVISSEPLMVDENVFEYMKFTKLLTELKDQYSMDIIMQGEDGNAFVMIVTLEGKKVKQEQMILARAAFIEAYHNTMTICTEEVCEISGNIPSEYREEILAETLLTHPDIMIRTLPDKTNSYIFVGPAQKVKHCRHFFMTHANKFAIKVDHQFQSTRIAAGINLERSNKLQCMEAKMIEDQAMIASALNGGQSAMHRVAHGHAEPPQQKDAVTDNYGDMPDLEVMIEKYEQQSLEKAQVPQDEVEEKKDPVPAKTKGTSRPVVELFTSSSSDDDNDDGAGDKQPKGDDDLKDHRLKPDADRAVDCKKDSHLFSHECLDFPKDWYLSLSEPCTCKQCTEETKEIIRLGCKHEFCLACVKNPSRMPGLCPQCGIGFDREQFCELEKDLSQTLSAKTEQRKHEPNKVPTATASAKPAPASDSQSSEKPQFRPELQGDGTFIKASSDKLCGQCAELCQWRVLLKCGHELCVTCFRKLPKCPVCGASINTKNCYRPKSDLSHIMDKKMHLPNFEKFGTLCVTFSFSAGEVKSTAYPSTRFETYLPNNVDGRSLFRLILEANKEKKMFELLPTDKGHGIIYPVDGLFFRKDKKTIDAEYLTELERALRKQLKKEEKV